MLNALYAGLFTGADPTADVLRPMPSPETDLSFEAQLNSARLGPSNGNPGATEATAAGSAEVFAEANAPIAVGSTVPDQAVPTVTSAEWPQTSQPADDRWLTFSRPGAPPLDPLADMASPEVTEVAAGAVATGVMTTAGRPNTELPEASAEAVADERLDAFSSAPVQPALNGPGAPGLQPAGAGLPAASAVLPGFLVGPAQSEAVAEGSAGAVTSVISQVVRPGTAGAPEVLDADSALLRSADPSAPPQPSWQNRPLGAQQAALQAAGAGERSEPVSTSAPAEPRAQARSNASDGRQVSVPAAIEAGPQPHSNSAGESGQPKASVARSLDLLQGRVAEASPGDGTRAAPAAFADEQSPLFRAAWRERLRSPEAEGPARTGRPIEPRNPVESAASPNTLPTARAGVADRRLALPTLQHSAVEGTPAVAARHESSAAIADVEAVAEPLRAERQEAAVESSRLDLTRPAQIAERLARVLHGQVESTAGDGPLRALRLSLNPASLGELEVHFAQNEGGEVSIRITTGSGVTREVLEPHLARVRANLEESGVRLGAVDVQVAQQDARQAQQQLARHDTPRPSTADADGGPQRPDQAPAEQDLTPRPAPLNRLLDTFA